VFYDSDCSEEDGAKSDGEDEVEQSRHIATEEHSDVSELVANLDIAR
jgi:hypothetical protein